MTFDLLGVPHGDEFDPKAYPPEQRRVGKRLPPGQTLAKKFPHLEYASIPKVEAPLDWPLAVTGACKQPLLVSMRELLESWPREALTQDFHCITGWSLYDTEWLGVPGTEIVGLAQPEDEVTTVLVHGADEFTVTLWIEDFMQGMLAYAYKGKPLSAQHGFPLRYVAPPHLWQYKSAKWVTGIEFCVEHKLGFWEIRAYSDSAKVWENDRYANPLADEGKPLGVLRREALKQHPPG